MSYPRWSRNEKYYNHLWCPTRGGVQTSIPTITCDVLPKVEYKRVFLQSPVMSYPRNNRNKIPTINSFWMKKRNGIEKLKETPCIFIYKVKRNTVYIYVWSVLLLSRGSVWPQLWHVVWERWVGSLCDDDIDLLIQELSNLEMWQSTFLNTMWQKNSLENFVTDPILDYRRHNTKL